MYFDDRNGTIISQNQEFAYKMEGCGRSCSCQSAPSLYQQTMDEMDFVRGVWTAALDGDIQYVNSYLEKDGDPNALDSSGYTPLVSLCVCLFHYRFFKGRRRGKV